VRALPFGRVVGAWLVTFDERLGFILVEEFSSSWSDSASSSLPASPVAEVLACCVVEAMP
jgi:hypothetical protein